MGHKWANLTQYPYKAWNTFFDYNLAVFDQSADRLLFIDWWWEISGKAFTFKFQGALIGPQKWCGPTIGYKGHGPQDPAKR